MEPTKTGESCLLILEQLYVLPRKMINLQDCDCTSQFVLYDMCHESCFNLNKAAYFVDNPDFNHLKGITGICKDERAFCSIGDAWENKNNFMHCMEESPFNKKVRSLERPSIKFNNHVHDKIVYDLAEELGIEKPEYCCWNMKHDNHGLFIFERNGAVTWPMEHLRNGLYLLSFCPIA